MAAQLPIPVHTTVKDVFGDLQTASVQSVRWDGVIQEFEKRFGRKPAYIARAPGRVNLIGDHIDYVLFGVLPAAVEQDILIACGPSHHANPGTVAAENLDPRYGPKVFAPMLKSALIHSAAEERDAAQTVNAESWFLEIDKRELRWESYVKAGYYGVLNHFFPQGSGTHPVPVDLLVTGSVPAGSGLSSSAAMVVASTLAFLAVNDKLSGLTKGQLVEMAMENEKRVGVNSGGMDQAASVISTPHTALYITFFPSLFAEPIPLPTPRTSPRAVFVCANSLVVSDKVVGAKTRYNLRVVETLVGARVLARHIGVPLTATERPTLREVLGRWLGFAEAKDAPSDLSTETLRGGLEKILAEVEKLRPARDDGQLGVTMEEMIEWSGLPEDQFKELYLSWVDVEATHFQLYKRTRHVFEESLRVLQFRDECLRAAASTDEILPESTLTELGALMDASHQSAIELCENSCPEVDELVRLAKEAGAYGSRVTGAGWGGCTVSLVAEDAVDTFIAQIKERYGPYKNLEGSALRQVIFATKPSSGACVLKFE
ncbi:Galactokinase [Wolfiporia cocos MD-104 SS10]|uniref:Galactokinase n=1 Tax=Wolfiporia cocos (strain MD-104) TaxID=742152 RepID=A0A2H3JNQ3_WOLCO|nr:Galactokinase [Wolfiporia cocos MD-104 SS10]